MTATIQQTIDELRRSLTEYLEATYHIGHGGIVQQRRALLEEAGGIFQRPYLESTPRYVTGARYEDMTGLPPAAKEALIELARPKNGKSVIFNPPYRHQADALQESLGNHRNLMITTGTGSGKTESFLLPILGKLAIEAKTAQAQFREHNAVRAMVLYPMNALVNDQLGRLRLLFGNQRVVSLFEQWAGRPALFARYTSRTPYAGVRSPKKDGTRLSSIGDFFAAIEQAAQRHSARNAVVPDEDRKASDLFNKLFRKGKWPAKESISTWFGAPGSVWKDRNGNYRRAVRMPHDAELLTRHEVQESPPDLLITNYSMLEYMMMRPIERTIFDRTRAWLEACPNERFMIVLDEAHLYRGAQGAEVGLLLRRLRERLGVGPERFQVICATASFSEEGRATAGHFGAQLSGVPENTFVPITGDLALRTPAASGTTRDAEILAAIDLQRFYSQNTAEQAGAIAPFLAARDVATSGNLGAALHESLSGFAPLNLLINETMRAAVPLGDLGGIVFPGIQHNVAEAAVATLLALGSRAKLAPEDASLLPCRIHSFFRGLPGLWACMDQECSELAPTLRGGPTGKIYGQPHERCGCGAPVLEYFTCRFCGTSYARAYTNDVTNPQYIWPEPGEYLETTAGVFEPSHALDLLLETPSRPERGRAADYDLVTGRINPETFAGRSRLIYLRPEEAVAANEEDEEARARPGEFAPCGCCNKVHIFGQTSVQDHQTKGDQPFQALLSTQIRIQPPGPQPASDFAPLRGRKILVFSDSRQVAARLAPTLQSYSLKDSIRALLPVGFRMLTQDPLIGPAISLNNAFLAVVIAAHRFGVRVRPEFEQGESMPVLTGTPLGQIPVGPELFRLMNAPCPVNLLRGIISAIRDNGLGLEPLAIASICESPSRIALITTLPNLPGLAETPDAKLAVARAWLRSWARSASGIWFAAMPTHWWTNEVRTHGSGEFTAMERVLTGRDAKRVFKREWLPRLLPAFTERLSDGGMRLMAQHLSLEIGGTWQRCTTCKSVHRPIPHVTRCIDCGEATIINFDPNTDGVFQARRGFYRDPAAQALEQAEPNFLSLIAAEHTAQLNAAQPEEVFSEAEKHEARFQDIDLAWRAYDAREPAIDVLSSTTTMEVGIDIGELSGVALRNMPPARANYQQRAGRAGRRGTAVATVVAFGSSDSHDDHYFVAPDEMIRGPVADPRLTLENPDIARRHLRAYLLQRYHQARVPEINPDDDPNLFSVLGSVRDFRLGTGVLHREDFRQWMTDNREELREAADRWLPMELLAADRAALIDNMIDDTAHEVDRATGYIGVGDAADAEGQPIADAAKQPEEPDDVEAGDEQPQDENEIADPAADKLLDRLLYWGVLPRYAFPTDVAPFYVFNVAQSTPFAPKMEFAPSQGLNIALSQYAPNKQIWIKGKQYTSKAIFSPYRSERRDSWIRRKLYFECSRCGHAKTEDFVQARQNITVDCEACRTADAFGPSKPWFRPPGFAHPIDKQPVTTPDTPNETAYATRAKLIMSTPAPDTGWVETGTRIRAFPTREKLLVSNSGPDDDGYNYCIACGRIETAVDPEIILTQPHSRPYPTDEEGLCPGRVSGHVVLGTDFITDIALFSLTLEDPFCVFPGNNETESALRTVSEAVAKAAGRLLQIESGEILADYRPALTDDGAIGKEVEIFVYDTLAGGAGFSPQLAFRTRELFEEALNILEHCPAGCDNSCYRCLRSFRNKIEHRLLDRKVGGQFLRHALNGGYPSYPSDRLQSSIEILFHDLTRQFPDFTIAMNAQRRAGREELQVPIVMARRAGGQEYWLALNSPIAPDFPDIPVIRALAATAEATFICVDDLIVRKNLPAAIRSIRMAAI